MEVGECGGRSDCGGLTPLTDTLSAYAGASVASLSIGAVSVQPGGTGVVLAGTGDPNDATDSYYGAGILRSTDGGVTWNLIYSSSDTNAGGLTSYTFAGSGFAGFAWRTTNPGLVVAAVSQAAEGVEVNAGLAATAPLSGVGESLATDGVAPLNLAFPAQSIGTAGKAQQVTLTNNGDQALDLIAIQVSGDFSVVNRCGASLAGHSSCAIVVSFVPTQAGMENGTLIVSDMLRSQTVTLAGTGVAPPSILPSATSLVFGTYTVGQTSPVQVVTLTNTGGIVLSNLGFAVTGDFAIAAGAGTCGLTLAVGAQCLVGVTFTPSQPGQLVGRLVVSATELGKPVLVALGGTGVPASGISATPTSISFGNYAVGQSSPVQPVTLTNNGGVPLTHLASAVTGDFAIPSGSGACGTTLAVGAQCQVGVVFAPSQAGTRTGLLTVTAKEVNTALTSAFRHRPDYARAFGDSGIDQLRERSSGPDELRADGDADQRRRH